MQAGLIAHRPPTAGMSNRVVSELVVEPLKATPLMSSKVDRGAASAVPASSGR
jgi:hypothetical protein